MGGVAEGVGVSLVVVGRGVVEGEGFAGDASVLLLDCVGGNVVGGGQL